jgi:hypothetical protein
MIKKVGIMLNPMTDDEIEELAGVNDIERNMLKVRKNGLALTDNQVSVLGRYNIDASKAKSMEELLYMIREAEDPDDDELTMLADHLAEVNYYQNTRK